MSTNLLARAVALLLGIALLAGCGQNIHSLRVPLDAPAQRANIHIDDQRAAPDLEVHTGGGPGRCERWYGDDTYVPPKLRYLEQLLAARAPAGVPLRVKLERFDTIEYCENTANKAAASASYGASAAANGGVAVAFPPQEIPLGDSVLIRLHGEINGARFAVQRQFDYSDLQWRFTEMPAANAEYRARFERAMRQLADEIVAKVPGP